MGWLSRFQRPSSAQASIETDTVSRPVAPTQDISTLNPLDVWHYATCHAFGTLACAPLAPTDAVLDVACGTGRWARELARNLPRGWVAGFDLDGRQIERALEEGAWRGDDLLPSNCQLVCADALVGLPYPKASCDYAHGRYLSAFVPADKWVWLIGEMARVTRPQGWIELVDTARLTSPASEFDHLLGYLRLLYERSGLTLEPGPSLERFLREAGLKRIQRRIVTIHAGANQDGLGIRLVRDLLAGIEAAAPAFIQAGIASESQVRLAFERMRRVPNATVQVVLTAAWGQCP